MTKIISAGIVAGLLFLPGCVKVQVEKGVNVDKDAIHMLDGGINPKMEVQKDGIHVEKDAVHVEKDAVRVLDGGINPRLEVSKDAFPQGVLRVEKGALTVEPGAVSTPLVEKGAFSFNIGPGAVVFQEGAIQLNIGQKGPPMDPDKVRKSLEQLKPVGNLDQLPAEVRQQVIANDEVMKAVIKSLLDLIDEYNKNHTTGGKK